MVEQTTRYLIAFRPVEKITILKTEIANLTCRITLNNKLKYHYKPKKITDEAPNLKQPQIKMQSHITPPAAAAYMEHLL